MVAKPKDDIRTGAEGNAASSRRGPSAPPPKAAANDLRPLEALAEQTASTPPDQFTLSSGVTLRLKTYNRLFISAITASVPDAIPPTHYNEDTGITEVNEQDPDYQREQESVFVQRLERITDYVLLMATELHPDYSLPSSISPPESDDWLVVADHLGYTFDPRKLTRYLAWLKLFAIRSQEDSVSLGLAIARLNGTLEEDVTAAVAAFPGDVAR